jgi:hypothetical protein
VQSFGPGKRMKQFAFLGLHGKYGQEADYL